jgi:hypothetical protein
MKIFRNIGLALLLSCLPAHAQNYFSPQQLDEMLAPIALYPDPLLAQVLPACAYPQEIDQAAHFVQSNGTDGVESQPWDDPVKAIAHYPDVLNLLDQNLAVTESIGQAFVGQQGDVTASIQRLRAQAYQSGNLNNPQEVVDDQDNFITIAPANPDLMYIPSYDPSVVYQPYDAGYYGRPAISFGVGFGTGAWLNYGVDWAGGGVFPYGNGFYWGSGGFNRWRGPGWNGRYDRDYIRSVMNPRYVHNTFGDNHYRVNRQHYNRSQLSTSQYNRARLNEYRGRPTGSRNNVPQWRTNGTNLYRSAARPNVARPTFNGRANTRNFNRGSTGLFNVQNTPRQVNTYQQRGEQSLRTQPNVQNLQRARVEQRPNFQQPQFRQRAQPQMQRPSYQPQMRQSAPSRSAPSGGHRGGRR